MGFDSKNIYLLLGSNMGDRQQLIKDAIAEIALQIGTVFTTSSYYETAAWGKTDQPGFINVALGVSTTLAANEVLDKVLQIEKDLGRIRHEKWGSRLIDIDLIFFGNDVVDLGAKLQVPHPEMHKRKFVLVPLAEIAPDFVHPVLKETVLEILQTLPDNLSVSKINL